MDKIPRMHANWIRLDSKDEADLKAAPIPPSSQLNLKRRYPAASEPLPQRNSPHSGVEAPGSEGPQKAQHPQHNSAFTSAQQREAMQQLGLLQAMQIQALLHKPMPIQPPLPIGVALTSADMNSHLLSPQMLQPIEMRSSQPHSSKLMYPNPIFPSPMNHSQLPIWATSSISE